MEQGWWQFRFYCRGLGVDILPGTSGQAKRKSEKLGLSVRWIQGDARTFDLKENFNFIYMTGSAFQAFLNNADQVAMPGQVRHHLRDDGGWTFETRNPNRADCSTDLNGTEWMTCTNDKRLSVQIMEQGNMTMRHRCWFTTYIVAGK